MKLENDVNCLDSYGMLNLPRTPGYHEIECNTWTPYGDT